MIQIETAMGAAIEVFEDARTIEVGRDRFVPVKTTNDLLVLRSDVYDIGEDFVLDQEGDGLPFVDLDPSSTSSSATSTSGSPRARRRCASAIEFTVEGDWTFGRDVKVEGEVDLDRPSPPQRVAGGHGAGSPMPDPDHEPS